MFTDLLLAQDRVGTLEAGVGRLDALITVLRTREEEGEGSRFDRLRAEREVAEVDADLALAGIDRRRAQARLAAFFAEGTDPDGLSAAGRLDDYPASPVPASAAGPAPERRPEYRALGLEAERWGAEERAARRLRLPSAQVTGGMKRSGVLGSLDTGFVVGASLSVPVFNRGQAQAARAAAAGARVEAERRSLAARIAAEVHAASAAAVGARELAERYRDDSVSRAAELVAIATAGYEEGEFGILELLDAHRVGLSAELRSLELSASARRAAIELGSRDGAGDDTLSCRRLAPRAAAGPCECEGSVRMELANCSPRQRVRPRAGSGDAAVSCRRRVGPPPGLVSARVQFAWNDALECASGRFRFDGHGGVRTSRFTGRGREMTP